MSSTTFYPYIVQNPSRRQGRKNVISSVYSNEEGSGAKIGLGVKRGGRGQRGPADEAILDSGESIRVTAVSCMRSKGRDIVVN